MQGRSALKTLPRRGNSAGVQRYSYACAAGRALPRLGLRARGLLRPDTALRKMADDATALPSAAELKTMVGPAGEAPGLNVVCRVDDYETLLQAKLQKVQELFAGDEVAIPEAEVHTSPKAFFRYRADFRVWHVNSEKAEGKMFYAMTPKGEHQPVEVQLFPMGSRRINELMPQLLAHVQPNQKLRKQLYEARFLTTLAGDSLITLIYHKPVNDEWEVEAAKAAKALGVSIVGRSRGRKMVVGEESVTEELTVLGEKYRYRQKEGAFSQPNAVVCQKLLPFAVECTNGEDSKDVDLLELYCGYAKSLLTLRVKLTYQSARSHLVLLQERQLHGPHVSQFPKSVRYRDSEGVGKAGERQHEAERMYAEAASQHANGRVQLPVCWCMHSHR
jgi:hypothetical protein